MNSDVTKFIEGAGEVHQAILTELRNLVLASSPDVVEQYKWSRPVYAIEKDFCYLQKTKKHVTIGFFEYEKIKTNPHLIEGTGKSMRHIKINTKADIREFQIDKMIQDVLK